MQRSPITLHNKLSKRLLKAEKCRSAVYAETIQNNSENNSKTIQFAGTTQHKQYCVALCILV